MAAHIPIERIENKIFSLRGHRVMFDQDLAQLYGVSTKVLNQAVKRNRNRFPRDFMFQVNLVEARSAASSGMRSQIVTASKRNIRFLPYVFTEHGAVMLANILKSRIAVKASIQVVRAFVHLRKSIADQETILRQLEMVQSKVGKHDLELKKIIKILYRLLEPPPLSLPPKRPMGFVVDKK